MSNGKHTVKVLFQCLHTNRLQKRLPEGSLKAIRGPVSLSSGTSANHRGIICKIVFLEYQFIVFFKGLDGIPSKIERILETPPQCLGNYA